MADIKHGSNPLFLREEELRQGLELLALVNRDFAGAADGALAEAGLGRAHHRALAALARHKAVELAELLAILGVTKQSFTRTVKELKARGLVAQQRGADDRRTRRLQLTKAGAELEARLSASQRLKLARAYSEAGAPAVEGFRTVLTSLLDADDRRRLTQAAEERTPDPKPVPPWETRPPGGRRAP